MAETVVIVGAGHGAGQAVATLQQKQFGGRIVLVGDEPYLPYQRPPLSKKYLAGELPAERLHFKPASFYDHPNIEVRLGKRIESIDRDAGVVTDRDGAALEYDRLILATGSRVRRIDAPGGDLDGVHYLRTIADVDRIRADLAPGKRAVIVGAGYIGLEVAAVCRTLGLDVTVLEIADRVMNRVVSPEISSFYEALHTARGVRLRLATGLSAFEGNGRVTAVAMDGGRSIPADLVVVGVGILPETKLARAAGLDVADGIVVDDRCRTADPAIYAIGDCSRHPNAIYGREVRLESVHNALEQARTAACNICGEEHRYNQVPWFWSDQYDVKLQIAGLSEGYDETVLRGDPATGSFACLYRREDVLIAVDAVNSPREFMQSKALIERRARIDAARLADPGVQLRDLA